MIKFDVLNPAVSADPKNVLYLSQTNTLQFIFSVSSGTAQFNPGDTIQIQVKTGLLSNAGGVQLNSNTDWGFAYKSIVGNDIFILTAQKQVNINPLAVCTVELSGFQPANLSSDFAFSSKYIIGGRSQSGVVAPIIILNPPGTLLDLRTAITFTSFINDDQPSGQPKLEEGILYLSLQDLDPPIANSIHLNFAYGGKAPLATGWGDKVPQFTIFFSYGTESDDLTDDIQSQDPNPPQPYNTLTTAWNINSELTGDQASYWTLQKPKQNTGGAYPVWIITPNSGNQDLFTQAMPSLDLYFKQVVSRLPVGVAMLYVQWNYIPGYFDGAKALPLNKQTPTPQVLAFECSNMNQQTPEPLKLSWTLFAANNLQLSWDGGLQSKKITLADAADNPQLTYSGSDNSITPDQSSTDLVYWAQNSLEQSGQQASIPVTVQNLPEPAVTNFKGVYQLDPQGGGWSIAFSWYAQDIDTGHYFVLNGVQLAQSDVIQKDYTPEGYPFAYSFPLDMDVVPSLFTLLLTDTANNKQGTAQCTPEADPNFLPQIVSFSATLERDANHSPQVLFTATLKSVLDNAQVYALSNVGNPPLTLDAKTGVWSGYLGVHDGAPVQQTYTLQALNRWGSQYVYKTIQTAFGVARSIQCWPDKYMPLDMCLNPAGDTLYVLSSDGNLNFALNSIAVQGLDNQALIASFNVISLGWLNTNNPPSFTLSVSPDNTQIMLTAPGLQIAILLNTTPATVTKTAKYPPGGSAARFAGNQNIFVIDQSEMYLFNPDPNYYGIDFPMPYGYQTMNAGQDSPTYTALAIRPDGQRGFVAAQNGDQGRLYWFDTDPANHNNPMALFLTNCNQICGLAMAGNNWLYGVFQWSDNNIRLFAFDTTSGQPYDGDCATNFGIFSGGRMQIAVSSDNSFVAVSNSNNNLAWLLGGTSKMNTPPALLQDNMLNQQLKVHCSMVFSKDNSRLFVAGFTGGNACVLVLEPVFS